MTSARTRARIGTSIAACVLAWLFVEQLTVIASIGNGLSHTADPYSEANAIRAAQHYAEKGFFVDAGLPHIVYGKRFPHNGWVVDLRRYPLPSGVYTRYPPIPDLLCGVFESLIGFEHLWAWRLIPMTFGLLATLSVFLLLRRVICPLTAGVMTLLLSSVPMATSHMHGLHMEGYAHSLLLTHLALLTRIVLSAETVSRRVFGAAFGLALLQGGLSFEYAFVVTGAAIPLYIVAGRTDQRVSIRNAIRLVALCGAGFAAAHVLHFLQVVSFYGSAPTAIQDYTERAVIRAVGFHAESYAMQAVHASMTYARLLWCNSVLPPLPNTPHFGPLLPLLSLVALLPLMPLVALLTPRAAIGGSTETEQRRRRALSLLPRGGALAMLFAYGLGWMWLFIMPSHATIHTHIVPRIFFLAYYVVALDVVLRLFRGTAGRSAAPLGPATRPTSASSGGGSG